MRAGFPSNKWQDKGIDRVLSCARRSLDWILRRISAKKEWLDIGKGLPREVVESLSLEVFNQGLVDKVVLGHGLDSMGWDAFSNLIDSVILWNNFTLL